MPAIPAIEPLLSVGMGSEANEAFCMVRILYDWPSRVSIETLPLLLELFHVPDSLASGCVCSIFTYCDSYAPILSAVMTTGSSGSMCSTSSGLLWVEIWSRPLKSCAVASESETAITSPGSKVLLLWLISRATPAPPSCVSSAILTMKGCWFPPPLSDTTIPCRLLARISSDRSVSSPPGSFSSTRLRISATFVSGPSSTPPGVCFTVHLPSSVMPMYPVAVTVMTPVGDVSLAGTVTFTVAEPLPLAGAVSIQSALVSIFQSILPLSLISSSLVCVSAQSKSSDCVTSISGIVVSSFVSSSEHEPRPAPSVSMTAARSVRFQKQNFCMVIKLVNKECLCFRRRKCTHFLREAV